MKSALDRDLFRTVFIKLEKNEGSLNGSDREYKTAGSLSRKGILLMYEVDIGREWYFILGSQSTTPSTNGEFTINYQTWILLDGRIGFICCP